MLLRESVGDPTCHVREWHVFYIDGSYKFRVLAYWHGVNGTIEMVNCVP